MVVWRSQVIHMFGWGWVESCLCLLSDGLRLAGCVSGIEGKEVGVVGIAGGQGTQARNWGVRGGARE